MAFSVLPNASYSPWTPVASMSALNNASEMGWRAGASSGFSYLTGREAFFTQKESSTYVGDNRVLAIARRYNNATSALLTVQAEELFPGQTSSTTSATVAAASSAQPWTLIDCGILSRASSAEVNNQWSLTVQSTATISLYGLIMLPDNSTTWLMFEEFAKSFEFDGLGGHIVGLSDGGNYGDVTGHARGAVPKVPPGIQPPTFAFMSFPYSATPAKSTVKVLIQEHYRFAV